MQGVKQRLVRRVHSGTIHNRHRWDQPKRPSTGREQQNAVYTYREGYSALKGKEILTTATTWRSLEHLTPSEISQTQKDKYRTIPLVGSTWKYRGDRGRTVAARAGDGVRELVLHGDRVSV